MDGGKKKVMPQEAMPESIEAQTEGQETAPKAPEESILRQMLFALGKNDAVAGKLVEEKRGRTIENLPTPTEDSEMKDRSNE